MVLQGAFGNTEVGSEFGHRARADGSGEGTREDRAHIRVSVPLDALQQLLNPPHVDAPENGRVNGAEAVVQAGSQPGCEWNVHLVEPTLLGVIQVSVADQRG